MWHTHTVFACKSTGLEAENLVLMKMQTNQQITEQNKHNNLPREKQSGSHEQSD